MENPTKIPVLRKKRALSDKSVNIGQKKNFTCRLRLEN